MSGEAEALSEGNDRDGPELYPLTVRVEATEREVTWHTSNVAYEQLHNHRTGNLVRDIEDETLSRDGSLFDVIVASSGAFWLMEVESQ